ncbi:MAG: phenylalanine--tRNA ligase subunit beta [Clostridia bacterium]|nr:phenylalanine--tRNA ligase subunit beta [Clostridia bacterium]
MLLSMNWIGDFVDLSGLDRRALIQRFTLSTAEVEEVIEKGADTFGVIVAKIVSVDPHPSSAKLHLLKIDTGKEVVDCVCGAPNVRPDMKVAFATVGASVSGNKIGEAVIAGYPSFGMCCSEAELGISADHSGLMEIEDDIPLGTDLKSVYEIDDLLFEVDNKSLTNRPDLWGHYGIAREFATLANRPLRPVPTHPTAGYANLPALSIDVPEPDLCFRYSGITVEGISVKKSPVNMRIRLYYCGSRAINLLADLTNYVMMELGQPMHAFDRRRVGQVEVHRFPAPFAFKTLDGVERNIDENMLMICSKGEPVAIAGVMGGLSSEIEDDTDSLFLESANFNGISVRKTSSRLGLRTDASMRYEKMLDPELTVPAIERFLALLFAADPNAKVTSRLTDVYVRRFDKITLEIDKPFVDRYTGIDISCDQIAATLTSLGFGVTRNGDSFKVEVPSWRATKDVTIKADLIEEITRIYGYDNFQITTTLSPLHPVRAEVPATDAKGIKDLLVSRFSLHEVHSYIWSDAAKDKLLGIETPTNVRLLNAQTPEHASLRVSMIPTLLSFAYENKGYADSYGLFEIGHTVDGLAADKTCNERKKLGVVLFDRTVNEETLYYRAHEMLIALFRTLKHRAPDFKSVEPRFNWQHPVNLSAVVCDGKEVGFFTTLHPAVRAKLDKKAAVVAFELDIEIFSSISEKPLAYSEPSRYPGIAIDLSFAASVGALDFAAVEKTAREVAGEYLKDVSLIDLYDGENGESVTLRFTFSSNEKTLARTEIQPAADAVVAALSADFGMTLKTV